MYPARWNVAWFMAELAQTARNKVRAEAGFHPDDARRQRLECVDQRQPLNLAVERDLASAVEADEVEDILADVDADDGYVLRRTLMG
jgi:hypothetical protein